VTLSRNIQTALVKTEVRTAVASTMAKVRTAGLFLQQGRYAARLVRDRLRGQATKPFRYVDKGDLATIGRSKAVADVKGLHLSGFTAWVTWLVVHLFYLIGFQNRLLVLIRWTVSFATRGRGARLIVRPAERPAGRDTAGHQPDD